MRNTGLDVLRCIAVLLVIGRHTEAGRFEDTPILGEFVKYWQRGGWIGVDVFFVLSGFLVSGLLFKEHKKYAKVNILNFLIRRGLKIYPAFYVMISFTMIVLGISTLILKERQFSRVALLGEITFTQNYIGGGLWNHTWSLAVEEHFYLLLALLVYFSTRKQRCDQKLSWVPTVFGAVAITCLGLRLWMTLYPFHHRTHVFPTHLRLDSLMFGVFLSWACHYHNFEKRTKRVPAWLLITVGTLMLSPAFLWEDSQKWISSIGLTIFWLGSGCLVLAVVRLKTTQSLVFRGLAAVGFSSYSIYLWHMPVMSWGSQSLGLLVHPLAGYLYLLFCVIACVGVGILMAKAVEYPVLHFRDRMFPSQTTPLQWPPGPTGLSTDGHKAIAAASPKTPPSLLDRG
jgi:peptidoglycan/LPS O-acetylase OafA/YrhL